jgi:O-antigen/teichoic acid export membrane protein
MYSAAPILRQVIAVGMTRLYTDWLKTPGFGVKEIADLWVIGLQQLLGQNVLAAMMRFYFEQKSERERAAVVTSCTLLVTLSAFLVCGLGLLFVEPLAPVLLGRGGGVTSEELVTVLLCMLLLVPFQLGTLSGLYYLQTLRRSGQYTAIQTAKLLLEIGLNFWLIGHLGLGVRGFLLSMLIGEVATSSALCGWILWTLRPRIDFAVLRPILAFAAPLVPVGLLQLALHSSDRRIVEHLIDQDAAGIYGLGYKVSYLVTAMLLGPFIQIWQPWIFAVRDAAERARLVARVGTYAVLSIGIASLGVILFGRQAVMVLGADRRFWEADQVIPFAAAGYVFWALYHVSQTPLYLDKKTGRLVLVNLIAVLANLALNFALIPRFGIVGAGIATCLTFALIAGLGMLASRRSAGVTFEHGRLVTVLATVVAGGAVALWLDGLERAGTLTLAAAVGLKAASFALLAAGAFFLVLRSEERARFAAWVRARLER